MNYPIYLFHLKYATIIYALKAKMIATEFGIVKSGIEVALLLREQSLNKSTEKLVDLCLVLRVICAVAIRT